MTLPLMGGPAPTVAISDLSAAPIPTRRLTAIGGDFPGRTADGRKIHCSLGASCFEHALARTDRPDATP